MKYAAAYRVSQTPHRMVADGCHFHTIAIGKKKPLPGHRKIQLRASPFEDSMNSFNIIADYLVFLNDSKNEQISFNESNSELSILFDQIANMMVFELYFSEQMKKET